MNRAIEQLQDQLTALVQPDVDPELHARLSVLEVGGKLSFDFFGSPLAEPFAALCACLVLPEITSALASVSLRSPLEEGANGTRNWDLSALVETDVSYPNLQAFAVEQTGPGDHNRAIVAACYEEAGVVAKLLDKTPMLQALTVPSAPDQSFFELAARPLQYLSVDAGYDTQNFIGNLADSSCFPRLRTFEFGEFNETYLADFPAGCTPFEDYRRLFRSEAFRNVRSFVWRNPIASEAEMSELRSLRPKNDIQIKIVQCSSRYI